MALCRSWDKADTPTVARCRHLVSQLSGGGGILPPAQALDAGLRALGALPADAERHG